MMEKLNLRGATTEEKNQALIEAAEIFMHYAIML
jgi:hypothetical protein